MHQQASTITKELTKRDLVIIPRVEYEEFLLFKNQDKQVNSKIPNTDGMPVFKAPKKHKKFYNDLRKELKEDMRKIESGEMKTYGPYDNVDDFMKSLES